MQPLPRITKKKLRRQRSAFAAVLAACAWTPGCGGGAVGSGPPVPPPAPIQVTVSPTSAPVLLGNTATFTATVKNTADASVAWSVNRIAGGNATVGTITAGGAYTAPADLPSPATVQITATSQADPSKSGTASATITSDLTLALTPNPASMELGATQGFRATVTSNGHPDTAVRWSVSGAACPSACGAVDANGNYTAPQILPSLASVTIAAQSVAEPSKQVSAAITITSNFSLQITAPASVPAGGTATSRIRTARNPMSCRSLLRHRTVPTK